MIKSGEVPEVLNFYVLRNRPEIVGFEGLNGPLLPGSLSKEVGGEAPHLF
jgi:hypothetical protein